MSDQINQWIDQSIASTPVYDLHTHIYPPTFGPLMLWGIDELLTYHYLVAEVMRVSDISYEKFWAMPKSAQTDHIWQKLFIERPPISEACRGVVTVLNRLGLDSASKNLADYRDYFRSQKPEQYVDTAFKVANVRTVVMTNDVLEPFERKLWLKDTPCDPRFKGVLRIDPLLQGWPKTAETLRGCGYDVSPDLGESSMIEIRRFLSDWIERLGALYVAVSLTPDWRYPDDTPGTKVIQQAILPITRENGIPFALMIGVHRQTNPLLKLAGDSVCKSDVPSVERLCYKNQHNKFLVTMLARENQHELAVAARKHRNLMVFGCWWFLNNPSLVEEITRMRMELLGTSFIPQHSDARVLDQIIYKWDHSRKIIAKVMKDKFADLEASGWKVTEAEVKATVGGYLGRNFEEFIGTGKVG